MYRAVVLLTLVGCYSPSYSNCTISCATSCPNSLTCDTQLHVCRRPETTCTGGDAAVGSDAMTDMDATNDGPMDGATAGCGFIKETPAGQDGGNLTIDLGTNPIAQGEFVVVAIAGRGSASIATVNDFNGHQFTRAIASQVVAGGTSTTSAIYYTLAAPVETQLVNVSWTSGSVTQTVIVGEWRCSAPPSGPSRTGMTSGASSGASTDTGDFVPPARSLVVASLAQTVNFGTQVQTPGFTLLDQVSQSGAVGASMNTSVWGIVGAGSDTDVTFSTATGSSFAGTAAAFTLP